jgi:hypothetical protein
LIGCCAAILWLKLCGTEVDPTVLSELSGPGTWPLNVKLAGIGDMSERRGRNAEVLGKHLAWRVLEPIAKQKGIVFIELAVIEDQKEFAAIRIETLDRMRHTRWEIPEVADADIIDESAPLRVDRRDARGAVEHVGPFGSLVPMQFANATGIQTHVHSGDVLGNPKFAHGDLTRPAAGLQPHMRVGKGKAQIGQRAVVGRWRNQYVRVLSVPYGIAWTWVGAAMAGTLRLGSWLAALRAGGPRDGECAAGGRCR